MASEITEDEDENPFFIQDKEAEKIKIRKIIDYQKSLYFSSSSSSSSSSSFSSSTCSSKKNKLLELMREGSTSLRRLFDMEHTSLANYFNDYSLSPIIKPILLWASDSDDHDDPWAEIKRLEGNFGSRSGDQDEEDVRVVSSQKNYNKEVFVQHRRKRRLMRTKSYKRLPRFGLWRSFKFKLRFIRKLRVMIRGRIF